MDKSFTKRPFKILLCLYLCFASILLTGCWDQKEINDLAIVLATGIDRTGDKQIELSVQIANPKVMGGGQQGGSTTGESTIIESATGKSIFDAISELQKKLPRRIFWGHNRIFFLGEKLVENDIRKYMDFLSRYHDLRVGAYVFVTSGKSKDILNASPSLRVTTADVARELANFKIGMKVTLKDLLMMINSTEEVATLPLIQLSSSKTLVIDGTAVLKKGKMIGKINDKLTKGVLWIRDETDQLPMTIQLKNHNGLISFNLYQSDTELIPMYKDGNLKMTVKIISECEVMENESNVNLVDHTLVKKIEKQLANEMNKIIYELLEQVQKDMEADIFGFAKEFHRKYPKEWPKLKTD